MEILKGQNFTLELRNLLFEGVAELLVSKLCFLVIILTFMYFPLTESEQKFISNIFSGTLIQLSELK